MSKMSDRPNYWTPWLDCDVGVLGGGPAGAAAAITLARAGCSVVVLERSHYDRARVGETLPPAARSPLLQLGVWDQFSKAGHAPSPGILSAWGEEELYEQHFIFNPHGHGWHLDRQSFDSMLAQTAERSGARVYCDAQVGSCLRRAADAGRNEGWQVEFTCGGQRSQLRAKFLIDATGRAATLARQQGAKRINADRLVGLVGLLNTRSSESEGDTRTLVEASADGWWYSALLPQQRLIAVYMTDADLLPRQSGLRLAFWQAQLQQTIHTQARLRNFNRPAVPFVVAANSSRLDCVGRHDWLAVGDAAMAFDPLSSQGLLQALASGIRAGETAVRYLTGESTAMDEYALKTAEIFSEYQRLHAVYYGREHRWPQSIFWQRRSVAASAVDGGRLSFLADRKSVDGRRLQL